MTGTTSFWSLLGIGPTEDEDGIRRAYARQLKKSRPDDDPDGFQRLVAARDAALAWAEQASSLTSTSPTAMFSWEQEGTLQPNLEESNLYRMLETRHVVDEGSADRPGDRDRSRVEALIDPKALAAPSGNTRRQEDGRDADIAGGEADLLTDIEDRERQIFERLHDLMSPNASLHQQHTLKVWEVQTWKDFFNLATALSFQAHRHLHESIARDLGGFLPDFQQHPHEAMREFARGHGVPAVIATIEQECLFAERPNQLIAWCGEGVAMMYFSWVARAQSGHEIVNRQKMGNSAYVNPINGLPLFPREDRLTALDSKAISVFYDSALSLGRWPLVFDWPTLFFPATRLAKLGLPLAGFALIGATAALGLGGLLANHPLTLMAIAAALLALLFARFILAFFTARLAVLAALRRVMSADQRLLWQPKERWRVLVVHEGPVRGAMAVEILSIVLVLLPFLLHVWPYMSLGSDMDRPLETVASETVILAFEGVADNDGIPTRALFDFVELIRHAPLRNDLFFGTSREPTLVRDSNNISWLVGLRARRDQMLGKAWFNLTAGDLSHGVSGSEGRERRIKLHAIADAYRAATPPERIQIENTFSSFRSQLEADNAPARAAAIWKRMPLRIVQPSVPVRSPDMGGQPFDDLLPKP